MAAVQAVQAEMFPEPMDVAAETDPEARPNICKTTILDLNEDCWRAILDYIPDGQIVRSERVSRRWQGVVHRYLRDAGVCFVPFSINFKHYDVKILAKNRVFTIDFRSIFNHSETEDILEFLDKWGPCIVHTLCPSPEIFEKITQCCPELKSLAITINTFRSVPLSQNQAAFVERLERIVFINYTSKERNMMDDQRMKQSLYFKTEIYHHSNISLRDISATKDFWPNFRPKNLQSLTVRGMFDFQYFLATVDFPALTDLNLQGDLHNVQDLLKRTPELERLCMMRWYMKYDVARGVFCGPVCGLQKLKTLVLWNCDVESRWLEAMLSDCPELQFLELINKLHNIFDQISTWAQALCAAVGRSLTALRNPFRILQDSDVTTVIKGCPKLTALDVRGCNNLSPELLDMAAHATRGRQNPLWLFIRDTGAISPYCYDEGVLGQLIVDMDFNDELYQNDLRPRQYIAGMVSNL